MYVCFICVLVFGQKKREKQRRKIEPARKSRMKLRFAQIDIGFINSNQWVHLRFGNAVTVVEMDGEIDMDNMEEQLKDPEMKEKDMKASRSSEESGRMLEDCFLMPT